MDDRDQSLVTDLLTRQHHQPAEHFTADCPGSDIAENQSLVELLQNKIQKLETSSRQGGGETVTTGSPLIDSLLPAGGLLRGTLVEWFAATHGCGREMLSLLAAREATRNGGALVIIDPKRTFYPPAAAAWGIDLDNTMVIRETRNNKTLWAIDQCLRSISVAAVWGPLGQVDERWLRRFQLSAEDTGTLGLFTRPQPLRYQPSWSEVQWLIEPQSLPASSSCVSREVPMDKQHRYFRLHLLRCRGGLAGKSIDLRVDLQTGKLTRQRVQHESRYGNSVATGIGGLTGNTLRG